MSRIVPYYLIIGKDTPLTGPPDQDNMWAWLRGDSLTGTSTATGWDDKTDNGRDFSVSGSPPITASGLNGHPTVNLGQSLQYFSRTAAATIPQPFSIVTMVRVDLGTNRAEYLFQAGVEGSGFIGLHVGYDDDTIVQFNDTPQGFTTDAGSIVDNTWHTVVAIYNGASSACYVDNVLVGSGTTGTQAATNPFGIGQWLGETTSEFNFNGDMAEFIIYEKALTSQDRTDLAAYVSEYYGI